MKDYIILKFIFGYQIKVKAPFQAKNFSIHDKFNRIIR